MSENNNYKDVERNKNLIDEATKKIELPDDATSYKRNQNINQGKDAAMNSTTNQAPEKDIHEDLEYSNNLEEKASNNKNLTGDSTYDKSNQNTNEVQDISNDTNKNPEDDEIK